MIQGDGKVVCDAEIWSRSRKMWVGCLKPAKYKGRSDYVVSGLDFCECHKHKARDCQTGPLLRPASQAPVVDITTPEGAKKSREAADWYSRVLRPFA